MLKKQNRWHWASATDPAGANDTLTYSYEVFKNGGSTAFASDSGVDQTAFSFTPDDNGSYEVVLTVSDEDGGSAVTSQTISVTNVAPELFDVSITSPINENEVATLSGLVLDPGTLDTFTLDLTWGDPHSPGDAQTIELGTDPISTGGVTWDPVTRTLERFLSDGTLDPTFGDGQDGLTITDFGGFEQGQNIANDWQGNLYISGVGMVARYSSNGLLDTNFGADGRILTGILGTPRLIIDSTDHLVVAGDSIETGLPSGVLSRDLIFKRYDSNGNLDPTFGTNGTAIVGASSPSFRDEQLRSLTLDAGERILATGNAEARGYSPAPLRGPDHTILETRFGAEAGGYLPAPLAAMALQFAASRFLDGQSHLFSHSAP